VPYKRVWVTGASIALKKHPRLNGSFAAPAAQSGMRWVRREKALSCGELATLNVQLSTFSPVC
jgi:hypothetical protein